MPQMSPMWWTLIMTLSIVMLIMTMTNIYFYTNMKMEKSLNLSKKSLIWMW